MCFSLWDDFLKRQWFPPNFPQGHGCKESHTGPSLSKALAHSWRVILKSESFRFVLKERTSAFEIQIPLRVCKFERPKPERKLRSMKSMEKSRPFPDQFLSVRKVVII